MLKNIQLILSDINKSEILLKLSKYFKILIQSFLTVFKIEFEGHWGFPLIINVLIYTVMLLDNYVILNVVQNLN